MDSKTFNMTFVYGVIAALSVLLLIGYLLWEKKREKRFTQLFSCVAIVNCGYFLQAVSPTLFVAMLANKISYFGAAYSVMIMLLIITDVCQMPRTKLQTYILAAISSFAFLLAASGTWLGLYYKSVSIENLHGMTHLVKVYGPLHILYPVYLLSYLGMMIGVILRAIKRNSLASPKFAVFLMTAVLLNISVWGVEQVIHIHFEFLSVSYVITEVLLLSIYYTLRDYGVIQPGGSLVSVQMLTKLNTRQTNELPPEMGKLFDVFSAKVQTLSSAERRILQYYIDGREPSEIPDIAFISIHTVKKHNHSIYQKLEVASRDELMLYIELFRCCGRLPELVYTESES